MKLQQETIDAQRKEIEPPIAEEPVIEEAAQIIKSAPFLLCNDLSIWAKKHNVSDGGKFELGRIIADYNINFKSV